MVQVHGGRPYGGAVLAETGPAMATSSIEVLPQDSTVFSAHSPGATGHWGPEHGREI